MLTLNSEDAETVRVGILLDSLSGSSASAKFSDSGTFISTQTATVDAMSCNVNSEVGKRTTCRQVWDGKKFVLGEVRAGLTREPPEEWTELYRGKPHHAYYGQPGQGRIRPVFAPALMQTKELRLEACGQDGRVYGGASPNFIEFLKDVRVTGTRTRRPKGLVTDARRRVVYVPKPDYHGSDSFTFMLRDLSGGSSSSDSRFSQSRSWSPPAHVSITVTPVPDKPLGANSIISFPPSDGTTTMLIPVRGSQTGRARTAAYDIHIERFPTSGEVLRHDFEAASLIVNADTSGFLRYRPPANACGLKYASVSFRLKETDGDGVFSATYTSTIDVRCAESTTCDERTRQCVPCPAGSYGNTSGVAHLCQLCGVGEFQPLTGQKQCLKCPPGTFSDRFGSRQCRKCAPGTANPWPGAMYCYACPSGYYAPFAASTNCTPCGALSHTPGPGSFTCRDCPVNTRGIVETSPDLKHCQCIFGAYDVKGRSGAPCHACPPGAYCHGRMLLPVPRTGYWTSQRFWTEDVPQAQNGTQMTLALRGQAYFAPCSYRYIRGVCLGYPDVDVQEREERCLYRNAEVVQGPRKLDTVTSQGIDVNVTACTVHSPASSDPRHLLRPYVQRQNYSANFYCAEGYDGVICSTCARNWRRTLEGHCEQCWSIYSIPLLGAGMFLATIGFSLFFWFGMFLVIAFPARSLYIVATHVQLLALLGKFAVPWPDITQNMLNGFDMLNLCLDAIHWNCAGFDLEPYWQRWAGELIFSPLIILFSHWYHAWAGAQLLACRSHPYGCLLCACRISLMLSHVRSSRPCSRSRSSHPCSRSRSSHPCSRSL